MTYISWFSDFALYLEYYLLDKCHTWDITSMWPNEWPLTISRSLWPIFHASVILPYILNTICWINVTPGILVPCDPILTSKYISVGVTYISWFSDFALYLEYHLLDKCHTWDITSMWPNEWPLLYLGHCDLYFMLQWFCLLFLLLFHGELSYLDYYIYVTKWFTYKYI